MNHSVRTVSCPTCRKAVPWTSDSPFRPFCSARCRQIDLGAWASESYRVPASAPDQGDSDDFFSTPSHDD